METIQKTNRGAGNIFPPPLTPYDWQVPIIKAMVDTILAGKNGLVLQPTATGKSVEAAFAARACILLHGKRGIYLYDENEGLEQARKRFEYIFGQNQVKYANFFGYGKDHGLIDDADIVFASFQSLNNHHEKWYQAFDPTRFDFMIVNEAHGGQAVTYKEVIDYFQCSKIGMTATPDRMDGKDILEIFGTVIFEMTLEEAIVKGRVAEIEYHIKSHGLSTQKLKDICREVLEEGKRISIKQLNETIFIDALDDEVFKEVYAYAFPADGDPRQTLLFCENIAHANRVAERIKRDGHTAEAIHSHHGKGHNRRAMQNFREGKLQFLISVDKLNEDIDVPNVEVAAFLRSTSSLTVFFQQLGRTLRKTLYKRKAIILDFVANVERIMIISDLMGRVKTAQEKFKLADGLPLQKDPLHVTGTGFEFLLTSEVVDMMKVLERIREGWYETWQEASVAAIGLGIRIQKEYMQRYKEDSRLPSNPWHFYPDFPGIGIFLNNALYSTWQEAGDAAKKLGIIGVKEYAEKYKQDSRLPSSPNSQYSDFPGWPKFLGTAPYENWEEATDAIRGLGITSMRHYRKRKAYKVDPKLPSSPDVFYEDFPGWTKFLNPTGDITFYSVWQKASEVLKNHKLRSRDEYLKRFKEIDPRLHQEPEKFYEDFPGWAIFLSSSNYYTTWEEASVAAISLGIKNSREYRKRYREDPKLVCMPEKKYPDFPEWKKFLGKFYPTYKEAKEAARKLNLTSSIAYQEARKKDERLPSKPQIEYADWIDWYDFLGNEQPNKKFKTKNK